MTPERAKPSGRAKDAGKGVDGRPTLKGLFRQIIGSLRYVPQELQWVKRIAPDVIMVRPDHILSYMVTSKFAKIPLVLECDGPVEELDQYWGLDSRWIRPIDTWRASYAKALLYISKPCGELWEKKHISSEKLFYTPNAAHPKRFKPLTLDRRESLRHTFGISNSKVFGFSGNLRSWHGVDVLLAAIIPMMDRDPTVKLLFIGAVDDPDFLARQNIPLKYYRERIVFTGPVDYPIMGDHIDLADCMVIPYPHSDFFYFSPMKLFEAMSLGKLIVASRLGQIDEVLGDLKSPLLYDPKDPTALGKTLEVARNRIGMASEGEMLGADVRERIKAEHTWAHRGHTVIQACEYALCATAGAKK